MYVTNSIRKVFFRSMYIFLQFYFFFSQKRLFSLFALRILIVCVLYKTKQHEIIISFHFIPITEIEMSTSKNSKLSVYRLLMSQMDVLRVGLSSTLQFRNVIFMKTEKKRSHMIYNDTSNSSNVVS